MRRIHKILACIGLSLALFLASEQKECQATGYPTIDISNLLQNILGFIQDADAAGLWEKMSSFAMQAEEYEEKIRKFTEYITMIQQIVKAGSVVMEIVETTSYFVQEITYFADCVQWFMNNNALTSIKFAADACMKGFKVYFTKATEEANAKSTFFDSMKSGDAIVIMDTIETFLKEMRAEFYQVDNFFRSEMASCYCMHQRFKVAEMNNSFCNNVVFF